jgi:hypothetical protein
MSTVKKRKFELDVHDENEPFYYIYEPRTAKRPNSLLTSNIRTNKANNNTSNNSLLTANSTSTSNTTQVEEELFALKPSSPKLNLFAMTLRFVALHSDMIDSLCGFPSLIGEIIFNECMLKLKKPSISKLEIFIRAYPDLVCTSLNLSNRDIVEYRGLLDILKNSHLTHLDLGNSDLLFNQFDLLDFLRSSENSLESLSLRNNSLNDLYIRKLTMSTRLGLCRFAQLRHLNLSENPRLTRACLGFLHKFERLNEIVASEGELKEGDGTFKRCMCSKGNSVKDVVVETKGWLASVCLEDLRDVNVISTPKTIGEYFKN